MTHRRTLVALLAFVLLFGGALTTSAPPVSSESEEQGTMYLPLITAQMRPNVFGVQSYALGQPAYAARANELGVHWARIDKVSWRQIQPTQGAPYNWASMADAEADLLAISGAGMKPVLVVNDNPRWATVHASSCSAVRSDRFNDFGAFLQALVSRYSKPPFNVRHFEIGNEPDVDPALVPPDAVWGCWGNINDPWYGGEHYGNMLKSVVPRMRAADPAVKVWMGGLLLNNYNTTEPGRGKPENFLEGVLRAGGGPYINYVPYHGHSSYLGRYIDHSGAGGGWLPWGGPAAGKPAFLREVMGRYGVNIPLMFNEASLGFDGANATNDFYQAQADHVSRAFVRSLHNGVAGVTWFTLEGPMWRFSGLLNGAGNPLPSYDAYQTLIQQVAAATAAPTSVSYLPTVEAYRFGLGSYVVDAVWSRTPTPAVISIPQAKFLSATDRDGNPITPTIIAGNATITVGWGTVYIKRQP